MQIIFGFFIALIGALCAQTFNAPLPWMLGPLVFMAVAKTNGLKVGCHGVFRNMGQWVIGTLLGLYFTAHVFDIIVSLFPFLILSSLFALCLGVCGTFTLRKLTHIDFNTAFFSCTIGGASEMANLAERNGGDTQLIASAHSFRVLLVVCIIPSIYYALGLHGNLDGPQLLNVYSWLGLFKIIILTSIAGFICLRLNLPNAWVLGPLFVTILLTSNSIYLSHLPPEIQKLGQLFIGWSLGNNFRPGFFKKAPKFLLSISLIVVLYLLLSFAFACVVAYFSGIPLNAIFLGLSPGGIAEMTITAKVLMLGVPVVTTFHVVRLVFILLTAEPVFNFLNKRQKDRNRIS